MSRSPDVTFYIPARDAARTLPAAIASVRAQTVQPDELLVVLDARSTDDTYDVARAAGVRIVEQRDGRLGRARNLAIEACRTAWLASCDSDVTLRPDWLAHLLDAAQRPARAGPLAAVGGRTEERLHTPADRWRAVNMPHNWGPARLDQPYMLVSEMLASTAALRAVGGYRPDLFYYDDSDLCARLRGAGYTLRYEPAAEAWHDRRDTPASVLDLRWHYSAHRQRALLESIDGLTAKLDVNRVYALSTLSTTLHSPHADVSALSLLLWFHHARRDLEHALAAWPLIDDAERRRCLDLLSAALLAALHGPWAALRAPILAVAWSQAPSSSAALESRIAPTQPTASGAAVSRFAQAQHTPGGLSQTSGFLAHVRRAADATGALLREIGEALADALATSALRLAHDGTSPLPAFTPPPLELSEADRARLSAPPTRAVWDYAKLQPELAALLGPARLARASACLSGVSLAEERPPLRPSVPESLRPSDPPPLRPSVVFMPHVECWAQPNVALEAALASADVAVLSYQIPVAFIAAVPILQPRDLASACAAAGLEIVDFQTSAGQTRIIAARTSSTEPDLDSTAPRTQPAAKTLSAAAQVAHRCQPAT